MPDLTDRLVSDPDSFLDRADVVVFANNCARPELTTRLEDTPVCDPVGTVPEVADDVPEYHSVSW
ncbi:hypothetical protein ACFQL4_11535 [Halosimplex aquaticum]